MEIWWVTHGHCCRKGHWPHRLSAARSFAKGPGQLGTARCGKSRSCSHVEVYSWENQLEMEVCRVMKWWFSTFSTLPRLTTGAINQIWSILCQAELRFAGFHLHSAGNQCVQQRAKADVRAGQERLPGIPGIPGSQFLGVPGCQWMRVTRPGSEYLLLVKGADNVWRWVTDFIHRYLNDPPSSGDFTLRWCLNEPRSEIKRPWKRTSRNFRKKVWFGMPISSIMMQV